MHNPPPNPDRIEDLLADRALFGLTQDEQIELDRLLKKSPIDPEEFNRVAAEATLAFRSDSSEQLPENLKQRILFSFPAEAIKPRTVATTAEAVTVPRTGDDSEAEASNRVRMGRREMIAWMIAATSVMGVLIDRVARNLVSLPDRSFADLRDSMIRNEPNIIQATWTTTTDASARGVSGDVIWSDRTQKGYALIHGLAKNEPFVHQYQLWAFDTNRDDRYPIDCGVFDVESSKSDVVVCIQPRLMVERPKMFAVTIEKRGGVVVSKRERLLLVAELPAKTA